MNNPQTTASSPFSVFLSMSMQLKNFTLKTVMPKKSHEHFTFTNKEWFCSSTTPGFLGTVSCMRDCFSCLQLAGIAHAQSYMSRQYKTTKKFSLFQRCSHNVSPKMWHGIQQKKRSLFVLNFQTASNDCWQKEAISVSLLANKPKHICKNDQIGFVLSRIWGEERMQSRSEDTNGAMHPYILHNAVSFIFTFTFPKTLFHCLFMMHEKLPQSTVVHWISFDLHSTSLVAWISFWSFASLLKPSVHLVAPVFPRV